VIGFLYVYHKYPHSPIGVVTESDKPISCFVSLPSVRFVDGPSQLTNAWLQPPLVVFVGVIESDDDNVGSKDVAVLVGRGFGVSVGGTRIVVGMKAPVCAAIVEASTIAVA